MTDADDGAGTPAERPDGQLELWGEMLAVQRESIASRDRAVDAMREGFRMLEAADERQFRYHTNRLERDDAFRNRQLNHSIRRTWAAGAVGVALLGVVVSMLFWGDDLQRQVAVQLVTYGSTGLGSLAVGFLLGRVKRS